MKKSDYPAFDLGLDEWADPDLQMYSCNDNAWCVSDLWEAAKDLPILEVPLIGMKTDLCPWDDMGDFLQFCKHAKLSQEADLSYPIILDPHGNIADGRHRFAKAIMEGHRTIKVQRLVEMPTPAYTFDDEGEIE